MRTLLLLVSLSCVVLANAQEKREHISYNKLIEVDGTDYVIATFQNQSKKGVLGRHILFVNTKSGASRQFDLEDNQYLQDIEHIRLDSVGVNKIVAVIGISRTENLKGTMFSPWRKIVVFSPDGGDALGLEGRTHFASSWLTNSKTGSLVVTGFIDSNENHTPDYDDKNEVRIYDLKNMKIIAKI